MNTNNFQNANEFLEGLKTMVLDLRREVAQHGAEQHQYVREAEAMSLLCTTLAKKLGFTQEQFAELLAECQTTVDKRWLNLAYKDSSDSDAA